MYTESKLIFPTLITIGKRKVNELEKDKWFSAYLEMSDKEGKSMDFLGYQSIHHDKRFTEVFTDIANAIRAYLETLRIKMDILDINITKSWFNIKTSSSNPAHNHSENHVSFTYYPHIHDKYKNKNLTFYQQNKNQPYDKFLEMTITEWNNINCISYAIPVSEGDIFIFPSKILHSVEGTDDGDNLEAFKTVENLKESRFCVGGDVVLTRKDTEDYNRLLPPVENWRKF